MSDKKLHLDSEYRRRWETYHLDDGTIVDSRQKNWREIEWERVIQLSAHIEGKAYSIAAEECPGFRGFVRFREFGREAQFDSHGKYTGHKTIQEWVIGWIDGVMCYLTHVDFYTGNIVKNETKLIEQIKGHIHPRLKLLEG